MILTRTPLRISLFGGGSDMPEFYEEGFGAVLSFAIDKYVWVGVNDKFDGRMRVSYSKTENVDEPSELEHELVRAAMNRFDLRGLEITSVADIPGEGSGLGSSSAFTVGLVRALDRYIDRDLNAHPSVYAELAYEIERRYAGKIVGKQDHYATAYGGLHLFKFWDDGRVTAQLIGMTNTLRYLLQENLMLFWTGRTRKADSILNEQAFRITSGSSRWRIAKLRELAIEANQSIHKMGAKDLGLMLNEAWAFKKGIATVSDDWIDDLYMAALAHGAYGGKILGAGGGGFLLFVAEKEHQRGIEEALGLRRVRFELEERGSTVMVK